jgi:Delta7-sterol 5-desaturase
MNTATHHNMHHQLLKHNFGLYFNFWDRLMGTNHPEYEQRFEEIAQRTHPAAQAWHLPS